MLPLICKLFRSLCISQPSYLPVHPPLTPSVLFFEGFGNIYFRHFPESTGVHVIAEPGRFFAEASASLFSPIFGLSY